MALSPVARTLQADLGASADQVGLLTGLPVLCFGLAAPLASLVIARGGPHRAVLVTLAGVLAGTLVRSAAGLGAALVGTVVIGLAITVGNIVVPVVIARDFARTAGLVTATYTAALNVGSTITGSLTAPLAEEAGWRLALMAWGALVVVAALVWLRASRPEAGTVLLDAGRSLQDAAPSRGGAASPSRSGRWWAAAGLTVAFGCQAFSYYGATAWLPTLLADVRGLTAAQAGLAASIFQVTAVGGAFGVPALLRLLHRPWLVLLAVCATWAVLPLGMVVAPGAWSVWCAFAGVAQGGGITIVFIVVVRRSRTVAESRRLSALVQGGGYVIGATGPLVLGAVHDATGGWTWPLMTVLAAVSVMAVTGALASSRAPAPAAALTG